METTVANGTATPITLADIIGVTAEDLDSIRHRRNRAMAENATPQAVAASLKDIAPLLTAVGQLEAVVRHSDLVIDRLTDVFGEQAVHEVVRKIQVGDKPRRRVA